MFIKDIFLQTFQLVKDHKLEILKNTLVPILLLVGFFILFLSKFQGISGLPKDLIGKAFIKILGENVLNVLLLMFLYIRLMINSYRMAILGPGSVTKFGLYLPGMRELKFIGYALMLAGIYLLFSLIFGLMFGLTGFSAHNIFSSISSWLVIIVGVVVSINLSIRLYFVFPAIASDEPTSFADAWKMSKGYVLKIMVITLLFPFVTNFVISFLVKLIPPLNEFFSHQIAGIMISWTVSLLFFVFTAMLMGMTFKALKTQTTTQLFTA